MNINFNSFAVQELNDEKMSGTQIGLLVTGGILGAGLVGGGLLYLAGAYYNFTFGFKLQSNTNNFRILE